MLYAPTYTGYKVTNAAASRLITLELAYQQLRHDGYECDTALLETLIDAATAWIEDQYGLALLTQTIAEYHSAFPESGKVMVVRTVPFSAVTISYINADGTSTTLETTEWELVTIGKYRGIQPKYGKSWPVTADGANAVTLTLTAGYGDIGLNVPRNIMGAALILLTLLYQQRENPAIDMHTSTIGLLMRPYERTQIG